MSLEIARYRREVLLGMQSNGDTPLRRYQVPFLVTASRRVAVKTEIPTADSAAGASAMTPGMVQTISEFVSLKHLPISFRFSFSEFPEN
jgi:hypothetical protein